MEEFADVSQTDALVLPDVEWWVDDAARIVKIIVESLWCKVGYSAAQDRDAERDLPHVGHHSG